MDFEEEKQKDNCNFFFRISFLENAGRKDARSSKQLQCNLKNHLIILNKKAVF